MFWKIAIGIVGVLVAAAIWMAIDGSLSTMLTSIWDWIWRALEVDNAPKSPFGG